MYLGCSKSVYLSKDNSKMNRRYSVVCSFLFIFLSVCASGFIFSLVLIYLFFILCLYLCLCLYLYLSVYLSPPLSSFCLCNAFFSLYLFLSSLLCSLVFPLRFKSPALPTYCYCEIFLMVATKVYKSILHSIVF